MTHLRPRILGIFLLVFIECFCSYGQSKPESVPEKRLAIQIVDSRYPQPIIAIVWSLSDDQPLMTITPKPLPGVERPSGSAPLTQVRIRATVDGDLVRMKIAGVFDDTASVDNTGPKYGPVEKPIGTFPAREGETIIVGD